MWAYLLGEVTFPRQVNAAGRVADHDHVAQPWFACERCKGHIDRDDREGLSEEIGAPLDLLGRLRNARLNVPGYSWEKPKRRPARQGTG